MKILMINDTYYPYGHGGAESYIRSISKVLIERYGYEIIVLSSKPFEGFHSLSPCVDIISDKFKIYRFYPLNLYHRSRHTKANWLFRIIWNTANEINIHTYSVVRKIVEHEKPDIIHTHNIRGLSPLVFRAIKSLNMQIPHIHTIHDIYLVSPGIKKINNVEKSMWNFYKNLNKRILHSPLYVLSPSSFALKMYLKAGLFLESEKVVLRNPPRFEPRHIKRDFRTINIAYVGALTTSKGVGVFLDAVKFLNSVIKKDTNSDWIRIHIAGTGPLLERIKKFNKVSNIKVTLYGYIDGENLSRIYSLSNIVVVPSLVYENFPQVVLESFSHSAPVIASNIGGIPEIVKHNYNGILVPPGDSRKLSEEIVSLIFNTTKLRKMERMAFKTARRYSLDYHITTLNKIYLKAIGN